MPIIPRADKSSSSARGMIRNPSFGRLARAGRTDTERIIQPQLLRPKYTCLSGSGAQAFVGRQGQEFLELLGHCHLPEQFARFGEFAAFVGFFANQFGDPDGNKIELWEPKIWDDKNRR